MSVFTLYVGVEGKITSKYMERWWSDAPLGRYNYSGISLSECHLSRHKSHSNRPGKNLEVHGEKPVTNQT